MKLYSVQYLRGLAALAVVIAHAGAHPLAEPTVEQGRLGQLGVALFFVISGFIMVTISGPGRFEPLEFLKRRIVRVVPLYWLFTTLAAALAVLLPALFKTTVFTWPHYLQSLLFFPHEAPERGGNSPLLSLGWTLNYEMFFYLCFALCAGLAAVGRVALLTGVFVALVVAGSLWQPQDVLFGFYSSREILAFCAGASIGLLFMRRGVARLPMAPLAAAAIMALAVAFGVDRVPYDTAATFTALVVFSGVLLLLGLRLEAALPKAGLLERLGDASYSTYLVHMFVVGAGMALAVRFLPHTLPDYVGAVAVVTLASLAAGLMVHHFVETPLLRWLRGRRPADGAAPLPAAGQAV